jgi:hypothetical protein
MVPGVGAFLLGAFAVACNAIVGNMEETLSEAGPDAASDADAEAHDGTGSDAQGGTEASAHDGPTGSDAPSRPPSCTIDASSPLCPSGVCCVVPMMGSMTCVENASACMGGGVFQCDDSRQCHGNVCCAIKGAGGKIAGSSCTSMSACMSSMSPVLCETTGSCGGGACDAMPPLPFNVCGPP